MSEKNAPILLFGTVLSYTFIRFFKKFQAILLIGTVPLFGIVEYMLRSKKVNPRIKAFICRNCYIKLTSFIKQISISIPPIVYFGQEYIGWLWRMPNHTAAEKELLGNPGVNKTLGPLLPN